MQVVSSITTSPRAHDGACLVDLLVVDLQITRTRDAAADGPYLHRLNFFRPYAATDLVDIRLW
jgi:hypothetical protein